MQSNSFVRKLFATFLWRTYKSDRTCLSWLLSADITFFIKEIATLALLFCFGMYWPLKWKLPMEIRKIQHISKRPQKYLKFDLRYSMPKYGKISTLKIIFFSFRLYIKIFEIFSYLLILNMSFFKEIWISLPVSHFHEIAHKHTYIQSAITCSKLIIETLKQDVKYVPS